MGYIQWTTDFDVHDTQMNEQHQMLFEYVNACCEAFDEDKNKATLTAALDKVIEYTEFHFRDEEKLMEKIAFPGFDTHRMIHRQLEQQVTDLREKLSSGEDVGREIKLFLKNWLTAHIKGIDTKYGPYLA